MKNKFKCLYQNGYLQKRTHLIKRKWKKVFIPKTLKQIARENIKMIGKEIIKN